MIKSLSEEEKKKINLLKILRGMQTVVMCVDFQVLLFDLVVDHLNVVDDQVINLIFHFHIVEYDHSIDEVNVHCLLLI